MMHRPACLVALTGLAFGVLLTGCATKSAPVEPSPPAPEVVAPAGGGESAPGDDVERLDAEPFREEMLDVELAPEILEEDLDVESLNARRVLRTVYFAFDSARLSDEALATLEANARWLREHPEFRVIVEGHCDERGTTEYNLNLGARRAAAIRDHLVRLGIPADRIETVSYGEERPVDPGHDESAWSKNRRGEFRLVRP